ncbi:MAG TPA: hypothetical protein PLT66_08240 [Bacillota bacterium]|nr:hypothetical protein [Bacillota bacterium]
MSKKTTGRPNTIWRIIITLVGVALILLAIRDIGLVAFGKKTTATDVYTSRYSSVDSNESPDKQYKWGVSWTFRVDGKEYSGSATVRGSATSVKHGNTVYYYPFAPQINSLYAKDSVGFGTAVLVIIGILLIVVINKKPKKNTRFKGKTEKQVEAEMTDYDDSVEEYFQNKEE